MKKEWQKPEIEVLDVSETMLGENGDYTDADFPSNTARGDLTFS